MNSPSMESSDSTSQDRIDFERFQGIWNNIKKAKESSVNSQTQKDTSNPRKSIASVKKAIEQQQQINIETRLVLTEKQLLKSKENTNLLLKKLSEAEEQIEYLEYELDKQAREKDEILHQFENLKATFNKVEKLNKSQLEKSTLRGNHTETELQKLQQNISFKQRQVDKLTLKVKSLEMNNKNLQSEISLLKENAKIMEKKFEENQKSLLINQQSMVNNFNKGSQILELEEAYNIIERLGILLKNTDEYRTFAIPLEDMKNYHFLKNIQQRIKRNDLLERSSQNVSRLCQCMQVKIDEKIMWSPTLCYKKALELKIKYNSNLTEECIEELLFEMNKIYGAKEDNALKRFEQMYQKKMENLRRKSQPAKYDELVARKQIERLKKQVLTERYSKSKSGKGTELSDNLEILKTIGQYEDELKLKERQILLLKERIRLMQNQNANYDKILYLEGSLWVLDKVMSEIELNTEDLQDFETKFRERMEGMEDEQWMNHFKFFFENITENQNSLAEKILQMKESTLKKMGVRKEHQKSYSITPNQQQASFGY